MIDQHELIPRYYAANRLRPMLVQDNWEALPKIDRWQRAKSKGDLTALVMCSDARVTSTLVVGDDQNVAEVKSISISGSMEPYRYLFGHAGFKRVVVLSHDPCGGRTAKEKQSSVSSQAPRSAEWYVNEKIGSPNASANALRQGHEVSQYTNKPVLTGWIENQTGRVHPDFFIEEGKVRDVDDGAPEAFVDFLAINQELTRTREQDEEFQRRQLVQNPSCILVSTSIIPLVVKSGHLWVEPNQVFGITIPYSKGERGVQVTHIEEVVAQTEFAIDKALNASEGGDFSGTKTLIVATPSLSLSRDVASQILQQPVISKWKQREGIILLNELNSGLIKVSKRVL